MKFALAFETEKSLGGFVTGEYRRTRRFRFSGGSNPSFGKLYDLEVFISYDANGGTFEMRHKEDVGPLHVTEGVTRLRLVDTAGTVLFEKDGRYFRDCGHHERSDSFTISRSVAESFAMVQIVVDGWGRRC